MIKFGLDKLLQSEESSVVDVDLKSILGGSLKGEWVSGGKPRTGDDDDDDDDDETEQANDARR